MNNLFYKSNNFNINFLHLLLKSVMVDNVYELLILIEFTLFVFFVFNCMASRDTSYIF